MSDIADQLAAKEEISALRRAGFGPVVDLIESEGACSIEKIAKQLGVGRDQAAQLLGGARRKLTDLHQRAVKRHYTEPKLVFDGRVIKTRAHAGFYIDPRKFTGLFARNANNRNRKRIAEAIHVIAQNFVFRFNWMPEAWREDAASEATRLGIEKIWHFQTNCRHTNAFSYFTKLVQRKVWEQLRIEKRRSEGLSPYGESKR